MSPQSHAQESTAPIVVAPAAADALRNRLSITVIRRDKVEPLINRRDDVSLFASASSGLAQSLQALTCRRRARVSIGACRIAAPAADVAARSSLLDKHSRRLYVLERTVSCVAVRKLPTRFRLSDTRAIGTRPSTPDSSDFRAEATARCASFRACGPRALDCNSKRRRSAPLRRSRVRNCF